MKKTRIMILLMLVMVLVAPIDIAYSDAISNDMVMDDNLYIQAGYFKIKENADIVYENLESLGFTVLLDGESTYTVYVGPYADRKKALSDLEKLNGYGYEGFIIEKDLDQNASMIESKDIKGRTLEEDILKNNEAIDNALYTDFNTSGEEVYSRNIQLTNDVVMQGVFGSYVEYMELGEYWEVEDAYYHMIYSQSDLDAISNSTFTLLVNDNPVYSFILDDVKSERNEIKIPIPSDYLEEGYNKIELKTMRRITENECTDDINPANWLIYHKGSYLHVAYSEAVAQNRLSSYPYPFIKEKSLNLMNSVIMIGDQYDHDVLTALGELSASFGQNYKFYQFSVHPYAYSELANKGNRNIIYMSKPGDIPDEVLSGLTNEEKSQLGEETVIKMMDSPYDDSYSLLLISSETLDGFRDAISALSNTDVVKQMTGSFEIIPEGFHRLVEQKEKDDYFSFKDIGLSSTQLNGLNTQMAEFGMRIPEDWEVVDGATLNLFIRYSDILNYDTSYVTVYINDIPAASKRLDGKFADGDTLTVKIPPEVRDASFYNIRVAFNLTVDEVDCRKVNASSGWAFISNESYLYLPHENEEDYVLDNYPSPFVQDEQFADLLIVMPEKVSREHLIALANICAYLGRSVKDPIGITIIDEQMFDVNYYAYNTIMFTSPDGPLLDEINQHLYLQYNEENGGFIPNEKIRMLDDYSKSVAAIQMLPSPYQDGYGIMAITTSDVHQLNFGTMYLSDLQMRFSLIGNAFVADQYGNYQYAYFGEYANKDRSSNSAKNGSGEVKAKNENPEMGNEARLFIIIGIFTMMALILISIILARKSIKHMKK